ncbi:hypothetical protein GOP47_0021313 [Adiantum capillus-veneris]|uniref:MalT-like TPR region domain-containing protein n=1 Tax=Adiantum capillus-veneris TaxID=13818 RepID=A0A9D4Z6Z6_ADICA|nr:hypothetical protein GOP47_0021313 [Adiantum capillus-veneris]
MHSMSRLSAENSSLTTLGNPEGGVSFEEDMSLDGRSPTSPASPHMSSAQSHGGDKLGSNVQAGMPTMQNADISDGDPATQSANQVLHDSALMSSDGNCIVYENPSSAEEPSANGGSEFGFKEEEVPHTNGDLEDKVPRSPAARHSKPIPPGKEGSVTQVSSHSAKLNPKKKPALSPRLQTKPKELEKDKLPSPRPVGNKPKEAGKERIASPRVPSPTVSAMKAKDIDKGKVESLNLPAPKEAEKEKISSKTSQELERERSKAQDSVKVKEKPKSLSLAGHSKRPSSLTVKPLEIPSATENAKLAASFKDREKASPNSPTSPNRSNAKGTFTSPLRPLRITPPPSSEKAPISTNKISPRHPNSRLMGPESPVSASKIAERQLSSEKVIFDQEKVSADGEKMNQKVKSLLPKRKPGLGSRKFGDNESVASSEQANLLSRENPNLGPFLLKLARQAIMSGDNPQKALDYASRAAKSYESAADGKPSLDLVMSLHILAATHCTMGQFEEAIPVLQHSIEVTDIDTGGQEHALAAFAGNMQLGDTYSLLGRGDDALAAYHVGLEVQKKALGELDPRVGETCRYLAEAHTQAMQFDKAEELCQHALNIHKEHSAPASIEEATDRRLMGLISNGKGGHEAALEHLVLASMALIANGKDVDVAAVDTSIGDTYVSLGRFDEAVFSYQKALTVFKASKGENHVTVASVYVSLAELYLKTGKFRECKTYCDSALRIFSKQGVGTLDEIASGLTELAVVYEALNEQEQALLLLKKALGLLNTAPGQQSSVAGVEAQIGVLSYMCGNYADARSSLGKAVSKLRGSAEKTSALFGIVLNQMGLCCLHLSEIRMAAQLFEESRSVLETACGPHHPDTLTVCSNLAGAYDALGRLDDAIGALQYVVEVREEELGTANSDVEDERSRLAELLREAGRLRARRLNNTLSLLMHPKSKQSMVAIPGQNVASVSVSVKG